MPQTITWAGTQYSVPNYQDTGWAQGSGNLTNYLVALPAGALQITGGNFTLTSDVNFGATYGLISTYFKSRSASIATAGILRLASGDTIDWGVGNLALGVSGSNLVFNGSTILTVGSEGNLTEATSSVLTITGGTGAVIGSGTSIQVKQSSGSVSGYLSSTDWTTFNSKQAAGNYITALTGDVTASGPGSVAATLATVNSNVGSFGSSTSIPTVTVNGKGLITAISGNVVIAPAGTLTGTTLASNVVTSSITTVGTIGSGTWQGTPVVVTYGGTGAASFTPYAVLCGGTTSTGTLQNVSGVGLSGQALVSNGASALPTWQNVSGSGTINSGTANQLAYYATSSNVISGATIGAGLQISGSTVSAKADGTTLDTSGSGSSLEVKTQGVSGSSANSSATAGQVTQGTISTPDLRANAVTNSVVDSAAAGVVSSPTTIRSVTLTTLGGPVLLMGTFAIGMNPVASEVQAHGTIYVDGTSTAVTPSPGFGSDAGVTAYMQGNITCIGLHTPSAGSHTYYLCYTVDTGTFVNIQGDTLIAVELRA